MNFEIDFSTPSWLINYYNCVSPISLFMNALGIYLLSFECKSVGFYRYYLISFLIFSTILDFHLTCLFQPVPLYPLLAGWSKGWLSLVFDDAMCAAMTIVFVTCILQMESLLFCFMKKHQTLALIEMKHVLPKWLDFSINSLAIIAPIIAGVWFPLLALTKDDQWDYLRANYPEYLDGFKTLPNFIICPKSLGFFTFLLFIFMGASLILSLFFVFIMDIFRFMKQLKTKMAKSTYKKHEDAVRSLQVQLVTAMICIVSPSFIVTAVVFEFRSAQLLTEVTIAWYGSHAVLNMTSMLMFFPPFRKWLRTKYEKIWGKIRTSSNTSMIVVS